MSSANAEGHNKPVLAIRNKRKRDPNDQLDATQLVKFVKVCMKDKGTQTDDMGTTTQDDENTETCLVKSMLEERTSRPEIHQICQIYLDKVMGVEAGSVWYPMVRAVRPEDYVRAAGRCLMDLNERFACTPECDEKCDHRVMITGLATVATFWMMERGKSDEMMKLIE